MAQYTFPVGYLFCFHKFTSTLDRNLLPNHYQISSISAKTAQKCRLTRRLPHYTFIDLTFHNSRFTFFDLVQFL